MTSADAQVLLAAPLLTKGSDFMTSSALHVVSHLGIVGRLAHGPRSADQLATEAGANADALYRVMRMLAAEGLFDEVVPRHFALAWPAERRVVQDAHAPELPEVFNGALTARSAAVIPALVEAYDFSGIDLLVEVAGGHGRVLTSVLKAYPRMRGVLFDLPFVVEGARPVIAQMGLGHRCRAEAGDMFAAVPAGGDAYILKHLSQWNDAHAMSILRNIRTAIDGRRGTLLLLDSPDARTEDRSRALLAEADFILARVVATPSPLRVVEAKAA